MHATGAQKFLVSSLADVVSFYAKFGLVIFPGHMVENPKVITISRLLANYAHLTFNF